MSVFTRNYGFGTYAGNPSLYSVHMSRKSCFYIIVYWNKVYRPDFGPYRLDQLFVCILASVASLSILHSHLPYSMFHTFKKTQLSDSVGARSKIWPWESVHRRKAVMIYDFKKNTWGEKPHKDSQGYGTVTKKIWYCNQKQQQKSHQTLVNF